MPFRADEQVLHVVACDVLPDRAAHVDDLAGRDHRFDPRHPVAGDAVLEGVRPAGVAGDVAADLRDLGRAGIGREPQAALAREALDVAGRDAGLDVHAPQQRVELAHLVQALEADHDATLDRDRPTGEPGAAAAGSQRRVGLVAPAHDRGDLLDARREDDGVGGPDDAAAHQIRQVATLRLGQRLGCDHVGETHAWQRTLAAVSVPDCLRSLMKFVAVAAVVAALSVPSALAATPTLTGTVGPGFTITLKQGSAKVTKLKAGKYVFKISDKSSIHNFHLKGPGVNKSTSVGSTGSSSWTLTLKKGKYTYVCDPHASFMKGSFTVS